MPAKITEREVASSLAGELTNYVRRGGTPFDEVTPEPLAGRGYPDIVVWIHRSSNQAFAFWELKRPGLKEDLSKLPQKAHELGVRYVVVWNFQHGSLYEVEGTSLKLRNSYPIPVLSSLEEWHDHSKRTAAIEYAKGILEDLARLARGQALAPPDKVYFTKVLQEAIHRLQPVLQERLFEARKDKAINNRIIAWTVKQGYPLKLRDLDALLARHWAYSLAVRILFYLTVRRYYTGLPDLRPAPGSAQSLKSLLQIAFSTAQQVDWQAVFENSPLDQDIGLPPEAEPILLELLENLHRYDFSQLKEDVIGQIMEGLIPEEERHALGQYFTREDLVDFILGFVAKQDRAYYLDPTCGSGTFLIRLYSRLKWLSGYKAQHRELLERIWGVDLAHFPAELATINLFRQNVQDLSNFPRVAVRDFFTLRPGQLLAFPPLRSPGSGYTKIEIPFPKTHGIVGNFPYIRQELIERQNRGYKQQIVQAIARTWFWQDPELFQLRQIRPADLEHIRKGRPEQQEAWLEKQLQAGRIELRLSGQADIHAYLFYHAAAFLEEGGRMGIVTSNAWLDAAYGKELKRFFLRHFKIIAIVASWAEPWFEDAAVNTAFIILERCSDPTERASNVVRFVKVKKPLSELLPHDLLPSEAERWKRVDALVREIESADAQVAPPDPLTGQIPPPKDIHTVETDAFRIRLVPQAKLEAELNRKGSTAKWGLYIRAPQVYFNLLHAAGEKLVPLSQVAEVRFGIKTGINDFFYLELLPEPAEKPGTLRVRNKRGWVGEIEEDLLHPALVSLKEVKTLTLSGQESRMYLFRCRYNKKELQKRGYVKALEYINWGEQQSTTGRGRVGTFGMPFPKVASVQSHSPEWFNLDVKTPGGIISNRFIGKRFGFPINDCNFVISDNFFEILPRNFSDLYAALLNSTLSFLLVELLGRQTWSQGVLYLYGPELRDLPVLKASLIPKPLQERIMKAFYQLKQRAVLPISDEVKQKDRRALDEAVLEALGLDPKAYLPEIYQGLVELVKERLAMAKMRANRKKQGKRMSFEQIKAHVRQSVLPDGLKHIVAFLPPQVSREFIPLTGQPVSWKPFVSKMILYDEQGHEVGQLDSEDAARYVLYATAPGQYGTQVPTDPAAQRKAVEEYEAYLREIGKALFEEAFRFTRDIKEAEEIAQAILRDLGLPEIGIKVAMEGWTRT